MSLSFSIRLLFLLVLYGLGGTTTETVGRFIFDSKSTTVGFDTK
jgi:hypothetical protein